MQMRKGIVTVGLVAGLVVPGLVACAANASPRAAQAPAPDLQRGIDLYNAGDYAGAEAALRGNPDSRARAYLAATLAKLKRYAEAEAEARQVLESNPTDDMAVPALGHALVGQDKIDEAVARLSAAIAARPDLAYAYYWRGQAYDKQKKASSMAADFQTFLKLAPNAPEAKLVQAVLAGMR
jgi:tetratricopeptide (TPR) repeat protein